MVLPLRSHVSGRFSDTWFKQEEIHVVLVPQCLTLFADVTEAKSGDITVGYRDIALWLKPHQEQSKAVTTVVSSS